MASEQQMTQGVAINTNMSTAQHEMENRVINNSSEKLTDVPTPDFQEKNMAENILSFAKSHGFEDALQLLADGKFDDEKIFGEDAENKDEFDQIASSNEDQDAERSEKEITDTSSSYANADLLKNDEKVKDYSELNIPEKLDFLKVKTDKLSEEIFEAVNKIGLMEIDNQKRDELLEILLIQLALNKSKDEVDEISLLEILVAAMTKFLISIVVDENIQEQGNKPQSKGISPARKAAPISFEEARRIYENMPKASSRTVEKVAA